MIQSRSTTLMLGLVSIPVRAVSVEEKPPAPATYCDNEHPPVKVKQTLACPTCGNADRASFRKGVAVGATVQFIVETKVTADHKTCTLTRHSREEVEALCVTSGATYALTPDTNANAQAAELYATLRMLLQEHPESVFVTTWGWTSAKTSMWLLDVQMDTILLRQMLWPEDTRAIPAIGGQGNAQMVSLIEQLINERPFDPGTYVNINARAAKEALAQIQHLPVTSTADLVAELQAALETKEAA